MAFEIVKRNQKKVMAVEKAEHFVKQADTGHDFAVYPWSSANAVRNTENILLRLTAQEKSVLEYLSSVTNKSMNAIIKETLFPQLLDQAAKLHKQGQGD